MAKKPNIVWFVADQLRADAVHHLGNPVASTPNLDALAQEGVSFANAYCQSPVCVPSRCSFLTGLYPHTMGHRTMHFMLRQDDPNILKTMKQAGYDVIWCGRNDFIPGAWSKAAWCDEYYDGRDLKNRAFEEDAVLHFSGSDARVRLPEIMKGADLTYSFYQGCLPEHTLDHAYDANCVEAALRYLDRRTGFANEKPFFLYCTLMAPHPPYLCDEPWFSSIDRTALSPRRPNVETLSGKPSILTEIRARQRLTEWSEEQFSELRATYLAMVARWDHQLGRLIAKLREEDLYQHTSIFAFSDHGDLTGDYGIVEKCQNAFEDPLAKVPLVIKPAEAFEAERGVHSEIAELIDLPVTVAAMAGIDLGYRQFGRSLLPALSGGGAPKDAAFSEGGRLHGEWQAMEPEHRSDSAYWPRISVQHEEGPAHTKACMIRTAHFKYIMRLYEPDQLYDLDQDPMELVNLIDDPVFAGVRTELRERLLRFYLETADYVPPRFDRR